MFTLAYGLYDYLFSPPEIVIALIGLDGAGKSTLLEQLRCQTQKKQMHEYHTQPTIGLSIGHMATSSARWVIWDLGGTEQMRPMWANYVSSVDGIMFVVDAKDTTRFEESKRALMTTLTYFGEGQFPPILIVANKLDSLLEEEESGAVARFKSWIQDIETARNRFDLNERLLTATGASARNGREISTVLDIMETLARQNTS